VYLESQSRKQSKKLRTLCSGSIDPINSGIHVKDFLAFKGHQIHYSSEGTGPVILLLHGFLESLEIWDQFAAALRNEFTLVRVDLPGHGKSDNFHEIHTMEFMATCVRAVLVHLNISQCLLAGHSMGGYVSLAFAENYPVLIKGLVLFHSQAEADTDEARENRRRTVNIVKSNRSGFIRQFIPELFNPRNIEKFAPEIEKLIRIGYEVNDEGIIAAIEGMKERKDRLGLLSTIHIPFLFIAGKQDSRIPFEKVMDQAIIPSHSEVLLLENVGHMGFIEEAEQTLKTLRHFALKCFE
jgi:pimeloyl-ACP methyl ester carboxylesterase